LRALETFSVLDGKIPSAGPAYFSELATTQKNKSTVSGCRGPYFGQEPVVCAGAG
ncbi:hypothetical protein KIL84_018756, partial [Mauremys mutica]